MATKQNNEIVWTTGDLDALNHEKDRLQDLIDEINNSPNHTARTAYQDACAALAWNDLGAPDDLDPTPELRAAPRGKAPAKGKKRPKR